MSKLGKAAVSGLFTALLAVSPMTVKAADEAKEEAVAKEEPAGVEVSIDLPILSAYVWRGQVLNDEAVIQPSLTVTKGGFSLNYWENFNLTDEATGDAYEFSEHDISISYSLTCPLTGADATLGIVNYDFPNVTSSSGGVVPDTREAFLVYGFSDMLLAPTLSVYYDFKEADGFYGSLAVSHSIELTKKASATLAASVGASDKNWNEYYYGTTDDAMNDWSVSLTVPIVISESLTISPLVQYSALIDSDIKDVADNSAAYHNDSDLFWGGVKATYVF